MIHAFCRHKSESRWEYFGEFKNIKDAESDLTQYGEPEAMEYMVIDGDILTVEEGLPIFPVRIIRN